MQLPSAFVERIKQQLGDEAEALIDALSQSPEVSILLNPSKPSGHPASADPVAWHPLGRYLSKRPSYVMDPHYHAGAYYPQEASSMLASALVRQLPLPCDTFCLDLSAAPGGKSIGLLEAIPETGFLIANEVIKARSKILAENLAKWGRANYLVASAHPNRWRDCKEMFDLVLVDAPCSGEGMFRKEPNASTEWSEQNVTFCASRQTAILADMAPTVKPGGWLIYSTCTYATEENLGPVEQLMAAGFVPYAIEINPDWGLSPIGIGAHAYQAFPHRVRGEGFFISVFQKPGSLARIGPALREADQDTLTPFDIKTPSGYTLRQTEEELSLHATQFEEEIEALAHRGLLRYNGLSMGTFKAQKFIPSQELAMIGDMSNAASLSLSRDEAISYLRRETFPIADKDDGWYLARFENSILGWIKIAAGRMKNHFPKEWMIRKRW